MNHNIFKRLTLTLVLLAQLVSFDAYGTLQNIKGTCNILNDGYKHLSLVYGAIAWETGFVRRLYDFGQIFPVYGTDSLGRKIITGYQNLDQTHMTVRLIHALFYRVPGSMSETDFGQTKQLSFNDHKKLAISMASILAGCEKVQSLDNAFQGAVEKLKLALSPEWQNKIQLLIKTPLAIDPDDANQGLICDRFVAACQQIPPDKITKAERGRLTKTISLLVTNLKNIKTELNKMLKSLARHAADMGHVLLGALRESDPVNPDALYMPHTTQTILLAFVYKTCGHDRVAMATFYNALNTKLDGKLLSQKLDQAWQEDSFDPITQEEALGPIKQILEGDENTRDQRLAARLEEFVYAFQQIRSFPAPIGYATAKYAYAKGATPAENKFVLFPNCMENAIRNFINTLSYNPETNIYDLGYLKKRMNFGGDLNPALEEFCKNYDSLKDASLQAAHDSWMQLTSNVPYLTYIESTAQQGGDNFITLPENDKTEQLEQFCLSKSYTVLSAENHGYNLRPALKNIILELNHLLSLNLFEGDLAKEFMRPDFVAYYFPLLCKKLSVEQYYFSKQSAAPEGDRDLAGVIDAKDFGDPIYTSLVFKDDKDKDFTCEFMTWYGHGELKLYGTVSESEQAVQKLLSSHMPSFKSSATLSILVTEFLCRQEITWSHLQGYPELLWSNLFILPLENNQRVHEEMAHIISAIKISSWPKFYTIRDLVLRIIEKQPDENQKKIMHLRMLKCIVDICLSNRKEAHEDTLARTISQTIKDDAEKAAIAGMGSDDHMVRDYAIQLFSALFEKGHSFDAAEEAAVVGAHSDDLQLRMSTIKLFGALFEKGSSFTAAEKVVTVGMQSDDSAVRQTSLWLAQVLVKKAHSFQLAEEVAVVGAESDDYGVRVSSHRLLEALIEKDHSFEIAEKVAVAGKSSDYHDTWSSLLSLFKALVEKGHSFQVAEEAAVVGAQSDDDSVCCRSLELFKALVEKGNSFQVAGEAAIVGAQSTNYGERSRSLELFKALFEKGYGFKAAEKAASASMLSSDHMVQHSSLELFKALFEKGYGFKAAVVTAAIGVLSDDHSFRRDSLELFKKLKLKAPERAVEAIQKLLDDPEITERVKKMLRRILE